MLAVASAHPALTLVLALAAGVLLQSVARHLRIPGIVLLLVAGVGLGPDGIGWVDPQALGGGLSAAVDLAVAVILFEGGLNLQLSRLRREQRAIRRLVTLGAICTVAGGAAAVAWFFDTGWRPALLFGGLVVVTGPTVVGPLIEELRLRPRVATVLEAEGVLIDPIGAIGAVLLLEIALAPTADSIASGSLNLLTRVGFGGVMGILGGLSIAALLRRRNLVPEGHENIFTLAAVLLLSEGCNAVSAHSGILAVTLAGVVVGNAPSHADRDLREFKDQLTVMLIGMLFVLLTADVRIEDVFGLGLPGLSVVAAMVLVVRPLGVWISTAGSDLSWRERALIGWIAPRGIVAAAVASVTAIALAEAGVDFADDLRALVFLTIAVTVGLAGFTAAPVASLLSQRLPGRDMVAILGVQGLSLALAEELRGAGKPVVFLDSNPLACRRAEEAGFPVVFGNAMQERTLLRARFEGVGTVIGLTPNQMLNSIFVSRTRDRFQVPLGYVAVSRPDEGLALELVEKEEAVVLFDGPHDVERWDVRARHDDIEVSHWVYRGEDEEGEADTDEEPEDGSGVGGARGAEPYVVLMIRRGRQTFPMSGKVTLKAGDVASIAIHTPEAEEAGAALARHWDLEEPEPEGD